MTDPDLSRLDGGWLGAHLYYHGALDELIVGLVAPLVADLTQREDISRFFFLRHWDGGPHLRLRLELRHPERPDDVRTAVTARAQEFFAACPSETAMEQADYARAAPDLARGEGLTTYLPDLCPDNSVTFRAYQRERALYRSDAALAEAERHFAESSRIALSALTNRTPVERRVTACYSIILLCWLCTPAPSVEDLSHEVVASWRDRFEVRADLEDYNRRYESQRTQLVDQGRRLQALLDGGQPPAGPTVASAWVSSVRRLRDVLAETSGASEVAVALDICAHLFCNRLGVSLAEERYVRYLAARTLTALHEREQ